MKLRKSTYLPSKRRWMMLSMFISPSAIVIAEVGVQEGLAAEREGGAITPLHHTSVARS
jgi:hypothetical protein